MFSSSFLRKMKIVTKRLPGNQHNCGSRIILGGHRRTAVGERCQYICVCVCTLNRFSNNRFSLCLHMWLLQDVSHAVKAQRHKRHNSKCHNYSHMCKFGSLSLTCSRKTTSKHKHNRKNFKFLNIIKPVHLCMASISACNSTNIILPFIWCNTSHA